MTPTPANRAALEAMELIKNAPMIKSGERPENHRLRMARWLCELATAVEALENLTQPEPGGGADKEEVTALSALKEGYDHEIVEGRWLRVQNPKFEEDNGENPFLVIDLRRLIK